MTETNIDISSLADLETLFAHITAGAEIILTRENMPIARISYIHYPLEPKQDRTPNLHPHVWISDEFDGFLPKEFFDDRNGL